LPVSVRTERQARKPGAILVVGATGHVGRQVVVQLLEPGARVRALVRNPGSAGLLDGAEVVRGDLSVPDTLIRGLDEGDASPPSPRRSGTR
jgi:uncharacterized protein YbjT (DUF2867 family)